MFNKLLTFKILLDFWNPKVRKQTDPIWYLNQTVQPLQQAYGRGIRDADDYCKMYILDEDFEHLVSKYNCLFNEYFLEGIQ